MPKLNRGWRLFAIALGLGLLTWCVFAQTLRHDFIDYDDDDYVYKNPEVTAGLTREGTIWAFTHTYAANWHPITWLSHMVDCQLFGLRAGGHHLTNLLLHSATVIVLFLVVARMTEKIWRSAFLAAFFAIHPLRVESVAWIAERKDLLSGLFFVLTVAAYVRYAGTRSRGHYVLLLVTFSLGLMCKPMLVSVPFVLLLLDYWPLQRFRASTIKSLLMEKLPLFALAIGSMIITLFAQKIALQPLTHLSIPFRLLNAARSTAIYLCQMVWPSGLVPFYPLDVRTIPFGSGLLALALVAGISTLVFLLRRHRYLVTGWLWYLVMLAPVIGIVQVGDQAHADRYTYLPQIGLGLAAIWGAAELTARWRHRRVILGSLATVTLVALAFAAHTQASYWRDSETLWTRTLSLTPHNVLAERNLGQALHDKGKSTEALAHLEAALALNPEQAAIHSALGVVLLETGRPVESLTHLERAVVLEPNDRDARYNLGNTLMALGRTKEAVDNYGRALERDPLDVEAMNNMAWLLATAPDVATRDGKKAVELAERADALTRKASPLTSTTLAASYAEIGRFDQAVSTAQRALKLASKEGNAVLAETIRAHLRAYESGSPLRTAGEPESRR